MSPILSILAAITTLAELKQATVEDFHDGATFALTGTVVHSESRTGTQGLRSTAYTLCDPTASARLLCTNGFAVLPVGSLVAARGHTGIERNGWPRAYLDDLRLLGTNAVPDTVRITPAQLNDRTFDARRVRLGGTLGSIRTDEVDPQFAVLVLRRPDGPFLASTSWRSLPDEVGFAPGAEVELEGFARTLPTAGKRHFHHAMIYVPENGIRLLRAAPADPFDVPTLKNVWNMSASAVANMGPRKVRGRVIAQLEGTEVLLRTREDHLIRANLGNADLPACGTTVDAVGLPDTDLFAVLLSDARCRPAPDETPPNETPANLSGTNLITHCETGPRYQAEYYGRLIRLRGTVDTTRANALVDPRPVLVSAGETLTVDLTACPTLAERLLPGATVELTGVCVLETEPWTSERQNPRIRGLVLAPRSEDDLRLLARPPYWTSGKLLVVLVALLAVLLAILVWNGLLQRLAARRGRQLFRSEIARAKSELRVSERTRLAADIHDSIAQTLTGVGFQIDAAAKTLGKDDYAACANFLAVAKKTLLACREELRRCIWDLRHHALEAPDLETAIRETVRPVLGAAELTLALDLPRKALSDTQTHALLCIVRELVFNAVRHGQAAHVRVNAARAGESLRVTVEDDGNGFDPARRPGPAEGHFGLQGISERVSKLGGRLGIDSAPGKGAHITVEICKSDARQDAHVTTHIHKSDAARQDAHVTKDTRKSDAARHDAHVTKDTRKSDAARHDAHVTKEKNS